MKFTVIIAAMAINCWSLPAGINCWTGNGPCSRPVRKLAVDPGNPAIIYALTDAGVYKSTDGGAGWVARNTGMELVSYYYDMVMDPAAAATLYAATIRGVFKSENGGDSWGRLDNEIKNYQVEALAIDPAAPATLYAGTVAGGVFKSLNGGGSFTACNTGLTILDIFGLAIDPSSTATVYAGTMPAGIFKSTDGGGSWINVHSGIPHIIVRTLLVDPMSPSIIYAGGNQDFVCKSTDTGSTWAATSFPVVCAGNVYAMVIDPAAPASVCVGSDYGVYRSTDGGQYWWYLSAGLGNTVPALLLHPADPATMYAGVMDGRVMALTLSLDVNADGVTDDADLVRLGQYLAGGATLPGEGIGRGDVTVDGVVNPVDLVVLLKTH